MSDAARDALQQNREAAHGMVKTAGGARTRKMLEDASADLVKRITQAEGLRGAGKGSFTATQLRATLAQVRFVLKDVRSGMKGITLDGASIAASKAGAGVIEYLQKADKAFRGVGAQPLALNEAAVLDSAREGARASVLRRLASSGEPVENADEEPHPAKLGVLDRYGVETIGHFEDVLQRGLVGRKSWGEMRADIIEKSPFLQQAPASWAERIVRTEVMGSYNRAGWEGMREADEQLGDMVKILSATFDDRTASDSYVVHGQIRRTDEAFETWYGLMQHPPARPNDREIVVPHRVSWVLPKYLAPRPRSEASARWQQERRKGAMPPTPNDSTVPRSSFGK